MKAYKTFLTIDDPKRVVLSDVPFRPGQRVEVLLLANDDAAARVQELQDLLKETQALPQARAITEEEISAEVEAYRRGQ